jgi:hypothetical protein
MLGSLTNKYFPMQHSPSSPCNEMFSLGYEWYLRTPSVIREGAPGRGIAQAVSWRLLTAEGQVRSQVSPYRFGWFTQWYWDSFSPSNSVLTRQYHSTNAPRSSLCTYCSYQKDKGAKPENFPKYSVISEIGERLIEEYFRFVRRRPKTDRP